ncbi:hypothetical protein J8273_4035 [Carpediemonas membranifera]|uniref:Uncharacterized protein n=1 Tax=Carpediemonas membranifera TaxID=201153 RepID=A0A8J6E2J2_9EUKA|nr:hypothetical protein J8273_4035 [Carpediemonas membranifera]|eukprot:KAG9394391.1 hypothetical protein J8273_4035 [Carpediemonas membranifera]
MVATLLASFMPVSSNLMNGSILLLFIQGLALILTIYHMSPMVISESLVISPQIVEHTTRLVLWPVARTNKIARLDIATIIPAELFFRFNVADCVVIRLKESPEVQVVAFLGAKGRHEDYVRIGDALRAAGFV